MRDNETDIVRCDTRLGEYQAIFFLLLGLAGAVSFFPGTSEWWDTQNQGSIRWVQLLALGFLWAFWHTLPRPLFPVIVADANGLRWRTLFQKWRQARWDEVRDFRDHSIREVAHTGKATRVREIETSQGVIRFESYWRGSEALSDIVQKRATSAKVRDWEWINTRPIDEWPRTFGYWDDHWKWHVLWTLLASIAFVAWVLSLAIPYISSLIPLIGRQGAMPVVYGIALATTAGLAIPGTKLVRLSRAWQRREEVFVVTPETILYKNPATSVDLAIPWTEVGDYFYKKTRAFQNGSFTLVLRGTEEKQISWNGKICDGHRLLAIVERYAPKPTINEGWRRWSKTEHNANSNPQTWQSGTVGMGGRVFRLRDPGHVMMLVFFSFPAAMFFFVLMRGILIPGDQGEIIGVRVVLVCALPVIYAWGCFGKSRIETDDTGITHYTLFGRKHMYWFMIEDYKEILASSASPSLWTLAIKGRDGSRLNIWPGLLGYEELKQEIERHAPAPKTGFRKTESTTEVPVAKAPDLPESAVSSVATNEAELPSVMPVQRRR